MVEPLRELGAGARLAEVRRGAQAQDDEQQERERGAVSGEEAGDGVPLSGFGVGWGLYE